MRASLRIRIVGLATLVVAGVLALTAVGVVADVRRQLLRDLDRSLSQRAEQIAAGFGALPEQPLSDSNAEDRFTQIVDASGAVIASTPNLAGTTALMPAPRSRIDVSDRDDVPIEDDTYRVLAMAVPGGGYVVVGENTDDLGDDVSVLVATLAVAFPIAVLALAAAMWWIVGRTLRPVESIRAEVAGIGLDELHRRVDVPPSGDEIARLATTMNGMLARLDGAVTQQRAFVADASHELRTPLTRLRTSLEVDLVGADPDGELAASARRALAETISMQHLVDDLLFLARHDAGDLASGAGGTGLVDLDAVIENEVQHVRQQAGLAIRVDTSHVTPVVVTGSAADLRRAISNLLSNAVRHARQVVSISLDSDTAHGILTIDDDGPGIPAADRDRVFGRFVRLDTSRTPTVGGTGLGLAIVRDVIVAHAGTITLDESPAGGTRAVITFPLP